ncbi:MAG: undecaprenyldiphospho-muramoylpentapeptide beta-N-acetylglucosaminyltransferase [Deltaproteobacteria bacterium]|nr:undecaprenyldiphospho-muramoylpentapeptide beta-N-acetylglucosaminyltransferase [Deltaproteobacteria bacterium]
MRFVIAGGGTGGHLFPAIALADEFKRRDSSSEIVFVGTDRGIEARVVPARGYRLITLKVGGLKQTRGIRKLAALFNAFTATIKSMSFLRKFKPNGVIGSGSYSSGPVVLAARLLGIKTAILEQNAYPGLTNRILGRFAGKVYIAFDEAARFFPAWRSVLAGNPVRREIALARGERKRSDRLTLFVFGGSQGATAVNAAFIDAAEHLADIWGRLDVVHQTGDAGFDLAKEAYGRKNLNVELHKFIDDMASAYSKCDLIVCRAGATSIAEITAVGIASILIPYPFAADSHQDFNAAALERNGAAIVIKQHELTGLTLANVIRRLVDNPEELRRIREAAKAMARPKAAETIADDFGKFIMGRAR